MDMKPVMENFDNWAPIRVYWQNGEPFVDWCYLHADRFTGPFFDNTIQRILRNPFSLVFKHQTPAGFLTELNDARPGLSPTGFIFHMSRCGSTLVSQMLASLPQNIVISEASPIDAILRAHIANPAVSDEQRIDWLKGVVGALGRKRFAAEDHYFIKFDSWNTLDLGLIRRAFPDVPWIFLYRDPMEVIVSQMRQRGAQMIPGTLGHVLPNLDFMEAMQLPPEEYCAQVLEQICKSALEEMSKDDANALLINYRQLPEAVTSIILDHFKISYTDEDLEKMNSAAEFDAKSPQTVFVPDSKAKKDGASEAIISASARVAPLYEQLETIRRSLSN